MPADAPGAGNRAARRSAALALLLLACAVFPVPGLPADERNLFEDIPAFADGGGVVNGVIEIPAGDREKWAVSARTGRLEIGTVDGRPKSNEYAIPYPFNYGMIPQTLYSRERGGDGDPVDIVVLGKSLARGTVVPVRVLGILGVKDKGERDDKVIGVPAGDGEFSGVATLADLEAGYPGLLKIVKLWFANYKLKKGRVSVKKFREKGTALKFVADGHADYLKRKDAGK